MGLTLHPFFWTPCMLYVLFEGLILPFNLAEAIMRLLIEYYPERQRSAVCTNSFVRPQTELKGDCRLP